MKIFKIYEAFKNVRIVERRFLFFLFLISISSSIFPVFGEKVDIEELKKYMNKKIEFINYTGKHTVIQSAGEIENIGKLLARERRVSLKYSLFQARGPKSEKGLDADIISIDRDATVDHIDNVRRIISGYLKEAYGYKEKDAHTLAVFVTIYNAVFRGNLDYFKAKYKKAVLTYLNKENAGISTKYYEWPGKTRLVIPLTGEAKKGEVSSVSTTEVTEKKVIENMQAEKGKRLEERKAMVELKEKEIKSKEEKKKAVEEEIKAKMEELARLQEKLAKEKAQGRSEEGAKLAEKKAREEKAVTELEKKKKELESAIAKKEAEVKQERKSIVKDERAVATEKGVAEKTERGKIETTSISDVLYFLEKTGSSASGEIVRQKLVMIDPIEKRLKQISSVKNITSRELYFYRGKILVVGLEKPSSPLGRIYLLEPGNLELKARSDKLVYPATRILLSGDSIFAVISTGNGYNIARFDETLKVVARSEILVDKDTYIGIFGNSIYVNSDREDIDVLNSDNLQLVTRVLEQ